MRILDFDVFLLEFFSRIWRFWRFLCWFRCGNREMMVKLLDFVGSCDDCSLDNLCAFV